MACISHDRGWHPVRSRITDFYTRPHILYTRVHTSNTRDCVTTPRLHLDLLCGQLVIVHVIGGHLTLL